MDIKTLKSFVSVATHQSFSTAAKELNTVQPAISRHISMLETELGVRLFIRSSRNVIITQAGEQLLKDAQQILSLTTKAKKQVIQAHKGHIGHLNIGYLSSACLSFIPMLVRRYTAVFPNVQVSLVEMTASEQLDAFQEKRIDIGFSRPLPALIRNDFICHDIYTDKLVVIVGEHHPLASESKVDLMDLIGSKFILFNREEAIGLFDDTITLCKQAGFSPAIISQPRNMQTLLTEVAAGLGIAIAPYCTRKLHHEGCHFLAINNVHKTLSTQLHYKPFNNSAYLPILI